MNRYLLGVAALFIFLLVLLGGRHPLQDAHQARIERKGDKLISDIEEHNKNSHHGFIGVPSTRGYTGETGMTPITQPHEIPGYMMRGSDQSNPYLQANPYRQNPGMPAGQPAAPVSPPQNSYYPPPPPGQAPSPLQQVPGAPPQPASPQSSLAPVPNIYAHNFLPSGQPIRFMGTHVYTVDVSGKQVPMPDGRYPMFNGKLSLLIRGGKHIIIPN